MRGGVSLASWVWDQEGHDAKKNRVSVAGRWGAPGLGGTPGCDSHALDLDKSTWLLGASFSSPVKRGQAEPPRPSQEGQGARVRRCEDIEGRLCKWKASGPKLRLTSSALLLASTGRIT